MEKFSIEVQGQRVDGTLSIPNNRKKNPGVIFFHGSGSSEKRYVGMAEQLMGNGIASLAFSMRGHGGTSEGTLNSVTAKDNILDAIAVYDFFVKQEGVDPERIGICGSSYGAVIGVALSEEHNIKSIVLRAPAIYTDEMMETKLDSILADEKHIFNALSNIKHTSIVRAISKFKGDLLIIASENDELIPVSIPQTLFKEASLAKIKKLKIMKNAPHALVDPKQGQEFTDILTKWFKETLF